MIRHPPDPKIIAVVPDELRAEGLEQAGVACAAIAEGEGDGVGGVAEVRGGSCGEGVGGDVAGVEERRGGVVAGEVGVGYWEVGWGDER